MTLREKLFDNWSVWALAAAVMLLLVAGCAHKVAAPLPPGAINTFDADSYRVLSDAHAAISSIRDDAASGKVTLNAAQTNLVDKVIADDNTADHLYQAYHANTTGSTTELSAAIQALIADLASLSTAFPTTAAK